MHNWNTKHKNKKKKRWQKYWKAVKSGRITQTFRAKYSMNPSFFKIKNMTREDKYDCIMIAEFMGAKIIERENRVVCDFPNKSGFDWWLDYDTKWDWLMPVLSKIEEQGCIIDLAMTSLGCVASVSPVNKDIFFNNQSNILIEAAYKSVVDYIKWYKKKKSVGNYE